MIDCCVDCKSESRMEMDQTGVTRCKLPTGKGEWLSTPMVGNIIFMYNKHVCNLMEAGGKPLCKYSLVVPGPGSPGM
jgi:hypothetical protein